MAVNICGTGSYIPSHVMDNDGIAGLVDTSDQWIRERTGVKRRHIVDGETTVSMACEAGLQALRQADVAAEEIDLILVSTISSNVILPCAACEVQKRLRAVNATCFDLSAACTGFVLAYNTAAAYLAGGIYKTALVI
ncbi:MAG: 3-oxoacyl-ACP synthase, partial [Lachnospiraceae bacterium]|nr:3-oxoacyl-ACP synthase [Lachnospiraceae bacterium]